MRIEMKLLLLSANVLFILGCGGGGGSSNNNSVQPSNTEKNNEIVLNKGQSITCSNETKFSVIPDNKPLVNFSKNVENGEITITIKDTSPGSVTVQNCTKI